MCVVLILSVFFIVGIGLGKIGVFFGSINELKINMVSNKIIKIW